MDIKITKVINKTTKLEINFTDERDIREAILKATPFMNIPLKCGKCGSDNITFQARRTKDGEFIYIEAYCFECRARRTMGEYKSPKGAMFWKQWEDAYKPNEEPNLDDD